VKARPAPRTSPIVAQAAANSSVHPADPNAQLLNFLLGDGSAK
jgi:hypothetical protein